MRSNRRRACRILMKSLTPGVAFSLLCLGAIWSQTAPPPGVSSNQAAPAPVPPSVAAVAPIRPLVMIDPAHGGSQSGAVLNPIILEKDVTLALARRLRQELTVRGILAGLTRDSDVTLSTDDRAARADSEHPALYLCLHASSETGGLKIFTAMLPDDGDERGSFLTWESAQFQSLANSRTIQQQLVAAIQKNGLPARALIAPLRPLNSVTTPALAIEAGPTTADVSQLLSPDYQQKISVALASGIAAALSSLPHRDTSNPDSPTSGVPH
jgi:N-acetylmuramoyl-L-alanine amidase